MRRLFLFAILLSATVILKAQKLHVTLFGGLSNYQGDLQPSRFTVSQSKLSYGAGVLYELNSRLAIRAAFTFANLSANDRVSSVNSVRNLKFSSPVNELQLGLEYDLLNNLNAYEKSFTPYIFAAIAGFHFNPSTIDQSGNKVFLQPLGTEGQGFYLGRKKYALTQLSIPFGGGIKLAITDDIRLRFEFGLRLTSTDYLDDVSTTYADRGQLFTNNGPKAVELAFRSDELNSFYSYPAEGVKRGNPSVKDYYYITGMSFSFRIHSNSNGKAGKGQYDCPVMVY